MNSPLNYLETHARTLWPRGIAPPPHGIRAEGGGANDAGSRMRFLI